MLAVEFIGWWYGAGFRRLVTLTLQRVQAIALIFSLPLLVRTLFAPWRRIISYGGTSITARLQAMLDNLISRLVGAAVRCMVILTALVSIAIVSILGAVLVVAWPLLPFIGVGLIIRGLLPW